jgi:hypothetical protein
LNSSLHLAKNIYYHVIGIKTATFEKKVSHQEGSKALKSAILGFLWLISVLSQSEHPGFVIEKYVTETNRSNSRRRYFAQPFLFIKLKALEHSLSQSGSYSLVFWTMVVCNLTKEKLIHMEFVMQAFKNCGLRLRQLFRKIRS